MKKKAVALFPRHCEERSDAAIQESFAQEAWIATLRSR
jgi:hypothetical protein